MKTYRWQRVGNAFKSILAIPLILIGIIWSTWYMFQEARFLATVIFIAMSKIMPGLMLLFLVDSWRIFFSPRKKFQMKDVKIEDELIVKSSFKHPNSGEQVLICIIRNEVEELRVDISDPILRLGVSYVRIKGGLRDPENHELDFKSCNEKI